MNIKILKLVFWLLPIFIVSGCYTNPITLRTNEPENSSLKYWISVTSEPGDADVYLNNILAGKTPCKNLPVIIKVTRKYSTFNYWFELEEQIYLRVAKEGYKDTVIPLEMDPQGAESGKILKKTEYNFVLEKK